METPHITPLPFSIEDLTDSTISEHPRIGKLFESKKLPDKIIRVESFRELLERHNNKIKVSDLVNEARRLYKELESKYRILVPAEFYIGDDKIYTVVDKIEGERLEELENSEETLSAVEKLYSSVAKYFLDKLKEGGLFLWDINAQSQYVYGKKPGGQENRIYLIDTDVWLGNSEEGICLSVYWLTRHVSSQENHFKIKFFEARDYIKQFVSEFQSKNREDLEDPNIDAINKFLKNEKSDYNPKSAIPDFV